jgi:hypothetical protein
MLLVKGWYGYLEPSMLYDVSDPVHPRLLCKISNTYAHLFTGDTFEYLKPVSAIETDVMLHAVGSGNESVAGRFPFSAISSAWLADLSVMAYTVQLGSDVQVRLYSQQKDALLFTYQAPQVGCICRFGVGALVLAVSADGQYLVAGPGLGSDPLIVYRVSDRTRVASLTAVSSPFWDRIGHRLFLASTASTWTPEAGVVSLKGATAWPYLAGESPDGSQIAYTAYSDPTAMVQPRIYAYDLKAATTRMLMDKIRTQVVYVKDGWVWYLDEAACDPAVCNVPFGTQPTGNLFAMQLSTGNEAPVTFAAGENPVTQSGSVDAAAFAPGEFWPAT